MRHFISAVLIVSTSVFAAAQVAYDRSGEQIFQGTIKSLASFPAPDGNVGVHFDLKTDDGQIVSVHVAPALYLGMQNVYFFADDRVQIVGVKTNYDGNVFITAKAVQKGSAMLVLRDDAGKPKWTGDAGTDGCGVNHMPIPSNTER
jgi:hypothetical protein